MKSDSDNRESEIAALVRALTSSDWSTEEIRRLRDAGCLTPVRLLVNGRVKVASCERVIDLSGLPYVPDGWQLVSSNKGGLFRWNPKHVRLHWTEEQKNLQILKGQNLLEILDQTQASIFNSNLLDYLLNNTKLIPEEWKKDARERPLYILFSGSIFIDEEGRHVVRALMWNNFDKKWSAAKILLAGGFGVENPSVVLNTSTTSEERRE